MKTATLIPQTPSRQPSEEGRARLLSRSGEPMFLAGWRDVVFIHFEVDAPALQRAVPYALDLREGRAYVSLVAFAMRGMRSRVGGRLAAWLFKPVATHHFLNVRTYVRHEGEPGIFFITEWLSNWLSVQLGPSFYGLPYRHAKIRYGHETISDVWSGAITQRKGGCFRFETRLPAAQELGASEADSLDEFLVERYTAFTARGTGRRFFRVWHPPWPQARVRPVVLDDSLLSRTFPWFKTARVIGGNYSPGFDEVWMGRAHRIR